MRGALGAGVWGTAPWEGPFRPRSRAWRFAPAGHLLAFGRLPITAGVRGPCRLRSSVSACAPWKADGVGGQMRAHPRTERSPASAAPVRSYLIHEHKSGKPHKQGLSGRSPISERRLYATTSRT